MSSKSLFDRVGGAAAVDAMIDKFNEKEIVDSKIGHYFKNVDMDSLRAHQKDFFSYAFGQPGCEFAGRSMKQAHKGLNITDDDFNAFMQNFEDTLKELSVGAGEISEVMQVVEGQRKNIVGQ